MKKVLKTHITHKPISRLIKWRKQKKTNHKPVGLWYGVNNDWLRWCRIEEPTWVGKYWYQLEIDQDKLLKISTKKQLEQFTDRYKYIAEVIEKLSTINDDFIQLSCIDWAAVAKEYDGIEIAPYRWESRLKFLWYYGWDCSSGCVWKARAIKSLKRIKTKGKTYDSRRIGFAAKSVIKNRSKNSK